MLFIYKDKNHKQATCHKPHSWGVTELERSTLLHCYLPMLVSTSAALWDAGMETEKELNSLKVAFKMNFLPPGMYVFRIEKDLNRLNINVYSHL